jgi:transposase
MPILFLGSDLAKNVFAVHGVDEREKPALVRPTVRRDQLLEAMTELPPCTIGIEACSYNCATPKAIRAWPILSSESLRT